MESSTLESSKTNQDTSVIEKTKHEEMVKINCKRLQTESFKVDKAFLNLPYILINIDVTLNYSQLKQQLIDEMLALDTTLGTSKSENMFTVTKKEKNLIKSLCQIFYHNKNELTTVQCIIKNSLNRYDRLVELKLLSGEPYAGERLIETFIKKLVKISKKIKILKRSDIYFEGLEDALKAEFNKKDSAYAPGFKQNEKENTKNTMIDSINKEASNYYEIYKIISQENYDMGKSISIFINDFKIKNENIETAAKQIPTQMKEIVEVIEATVSSFNNYFNFGKNANEMQYVQPAVEKFIFNKISYIIFDIYNAKYDTENKSFLAKQKEINEKYTIDEMMNFLEVKERFRCKDSFSIPYKSTIDCVNKIEYEQSPKEKLDALINAGLDLRNTLLGGGKVELNSMDDELPIFIYISTQIKLTNAPAEFHIVEDYLRSFENTDSESKVLTNLMSAVMYITNGWN